MASIPRSISFRSRTDPSEVRDIVLSILETPQLAHRVTRLIYDPSTLCAGCGPCPPYEVTTSAEERAERIFKTAIADQGWPEADGEELLKFLMAKRVDELNVAQPISLLPKALIALMLPLLPKCKKWAVGDVLIEAPGFIGKVLQRDSQGKKEIAVEHVQIIPDHRYSDGLYSNYFFDNFLSFALLPRLKRISGKGVGGGHIEDSGCYSDIPKEASDVEEIELVDCELGSGVLEKIIGFSRALKRFTYRTGGMCCSGGESTVLYGRQLRRALEKHRKSLRVLDLECDIRLERLNCMWDDNEDEKEEEEEEEEEEEDEEEEDEDEDEDKDEDEEDDGEEIDLGEEDTDEEEDVSRKIVEDFPVFPHLTHLRISYRMLMGLVMSSARGTESLIDWLPSTLEELTIVGYNSKKKLFRSWITEVLEKRDEHFPKLTIRGIHEVVKNKQDLDNEDDYEGNETEDDLESDRDDDLVEE